MSDAIASGMSSWTKLLESSHRDLLSVSAALEAEFERTYCDSAGTSAAAHNPARLLARIAALETAVPAAADAMLALARAELAATASARAATSDATAALRVLDAVVPPGSDGCEREGTEGALDPGGEVELAELCGRLADVSAVTSRANSRLVATEGKGTDEFDIDKALMSAGLGVDEDDDSSDDGGKMSKEDDDAEDSLAGDATPKRWRGSTPVKGVPRGGSSRNERQRILSEQRKRNGKENADGRKITSGKKPTAKARGSEAKPVASRDLQYTSIPKPEYQRLPRMLKQQAKLEELNMVYCKVFELLSAHTAPMPEEELLSAIGEESDKCIDVLRRGFSLLKRGRDGWSLGKAPPQTVGRSRPPVGRASSR